MSALSILLFAAIIGLALFFIQFIQRPKSTSARQRKLDELLSRQANEGKAALSRPSGRPSWADVYNVVVEIEDQRPTASTVNTILQRRGFTSSDRIVRRALKLLAKRGLLIRQLVPVGGRQDLRVARFSLAG